MYSIANNLEILNGLENSVKYSVCFIFAEQTVFHSCSKKVAKLNAKVLADSLSQSETSFFKGASDLFHCKCLSQDKMSNVEFLISVHKLKTV